MITRGLKIRDTRENIRLSKIAQYFSRLKQLRRLLKDNMEHYQFLIEFKEMPISLLEDLGVERSISEAFLIFDGNLTPDFIEQFRQTDSRRFWE